MLLPLMMMMMMIRDEYKIYDNTLEIRREPKDKNPSSSTQSLSMSENFLITQNSIQCSVTPASGPYLTQSNTDRTLI